MNADQQNAAIARALGWTIDDEAEDGAVMVTLPDGSWDMLPDFTGDLNACAIMERALTEREKLHYVEEVGMLARYAAAAQGLNPRTMEDRDVIYRHMVATAPQRCEAWLKAKGLWGSQPTK